MRHPDQEALVATLVADLSARRELQGAEVGHGAKNQILGASGYRHQIDISVRAASDLVLYECKYWGRNVGPGAVLALAARGIDIQNSHKELQVDLNIVVSNQLTNGARLIANYFHIEEQVVASLNELSIAYKGDRHIGVQDSLKVGDTAECTMRPARPNP